MEQRQWWTAAIAVMASFLLFSSASQAAEGLTVELERSATPDAQRESRFVDGNSDAVASNEGQKHTATLSTPQAAVSRPENAVALTATANGLKSIRSVTAQSVRSSGFYFYSASSALLKDRDHDGFHSELKIRFDADTDYISARVFAKLYLRRIGDSQWWLYHTTDSFWINGHSSGDDYTVITTLDKGYATADYDVLIDLYDADNGDLVATIDPVDAASLGYLPLEEVDLDLPIYDIGVSIGRVTTTLLVDSDRDNYYSKFRIDLDPDAQYSGQLAYAKIWVRAQGGEWLLEHTSDDFAVATSGSADTYSFTVDWVKGYPTALYDVQIDLYDSASNQLVAAAGSERPELSRVPLEDQSRDVYVNSPSTSGGSHVTRSSEHGGGAMTWICLLALAGMATAQRIHATRRLASRL